MAMFSTIVAQTINATEEQIAQKIAKKILRLDPVGEECHEEIAGKYSLMVSEAQNIPSNAKKNQKPKSK